MTFSYSTFICLSCSFILSGCATLTAPPEHPQVLAGNRILIEYTCRTANGALAATSRKSAVDDPTFPHSPLFAPLRNYLPANVKVSEPEKCQPLSQKMAYEEMLELLMARQALGAPFNQPQILTIEGELIPDIFGKERYLTLNRSFSENRQVTIPISKFEKQFKISPQTGNTIDTRRPGVSATVLTVENDEVIMRYNAEPGASAPSIFGTNVITQTADTLEFKTDAKLNTIIRSGSMIGKISEVTDTTFTVDYGHSSGFTPLTCEVIFKPFAGTDGLSWHDDDDIEKAKEESLRTGMLLLVYFHDQWDSANRTFLNTILPDPRVSAALNGYVRVLVNTAKSNVTQREYRLVTIPSILILDSNGKELKRFIGPTNADELAEGLEQLLEKNG
jgi:thiol:disulfide interchange protein DsbD